MTTTTTMSANPFDEPKGNAARTEASSLRGSATTKKVAKKRGRPAKVSEKRDCVPLNGTEVDAPNSEKAAPSLKKTSHAGRVAAASGSLSQNPRRQRQSSLVAQSKIRDLYDDDVFAEGGRANDPVSDSEDND